jgi:hypothetical protein
VMSLVACPECEQNVSTLATACPHCGFPMSQEDSEPDPMVLEEQAGTSQPIVEETTQTAPHTDRWCPVEGKSFLPGNHVKCPVCGASLDGSPMPGGITTTPSHRATATTPNTTSQRGRRFWWALVAAIVVIVVVVVTMTAGGSSTPPSKEQSFLDLVTSDFGVYGEDNVLPDVELLLTGYVICDAIDTGVPTEDIMQVFDYRWPRQLAEKFVVASALWLCDEETERSTQ